ncbi:MAG TPA: cellulase family glycosylhydrolase [bacterium]
MAVPEHAIEKKARLANSHLVMAAFLSATIASLFAAPKDASIVDLWGQLRVEGNRIVNKEGRPVTLRGMSLYWSQWKGKYYNADCIKWLRDDWKCTVVRAAMAVENGGYLTNPAAEESKITTVVQECIDLGMYVIIDWHDHNAHLHQNAAAAFFKKMAQLYGEFPNVIYEIYNEPEQVSWGSVVKPYSEAVIGEIRAVDPDNVIIMGTPSWCQDVHLAAADPIKGSNLAYGLHYYAASHKQWLRDRAAAALNKGIALFASEFGTCEYTGSGVLDYVETGKWFDFMEANAVSWCNWSIADLTETSAALKPNASSTGNWAASDLSDSGKLVREKIIALNLPILTTVGIAGKNTSEPEFILARNYPNPFNSGTTIEFALAAPQWVKIHVVDVLGRNVAVLADRPLNPGLHRVLFNPKYLPSGTYIYSIQTEEASLTGRMQLAK